MLPSGANGSEPTSLIGSLAGLRVDTDVVFEVDQAAKAEEHPVRWLRPANALNWCRSVLRYRYCGKIILC